MSEKRPLVAVIHHYSKLLSIGIPIVLIPFLAWAIWEDQVRHSEPVERSFYDVNMRVSIGPKSPPAIIIYDGSKRLFTSGCVTSLTPICNENIYVQSVPKIGVIETKDGRGIIKSISMNVDGNPSFEVGDSELTAWITKEGRRPWRAVYGVSIAFLLSIVALFSCRHIESQKSYKECK